MARVRADGTPDQHSVSAQEACFPFNDVVAKRFGQALEEGTRPYLVSERLIHEGYRFPRHQHRGQEFALGGGIVPAPDMNRFGQGGCEIPDAFPIVFILGRRGVIPNCMDHRLDVALPRGPIGLDVVELALDPRQDDGHSEIAVRVGRLQQIFDPWARFRRAPPATAAPFGAVVKGVLPQPPVHDLPAPVKKVGRDGFPPPLAALRWNSPPVSLFRTLCIMMPIFGQVLR